MRTLAALIAGGIVLVLSCVQLRAQTVPFQQYVLEDGIAHSNVLRFFQDGRGYMWLGTQYGLSRFDGRQFRNYTTSDGLPSNTVTAIAQLSGDSLLLGCYRGGFVVMHNDTITPLQLRNACPTTILFASVDSCGRIWLISKGGADGTLWECGYIEHRTYRRFPVERYTKDANTPLPVYRVESLRDSSVVLSTGRGAYRVSAAGVVTPIHPDLTQPVYVAVQDRRGDLWFAADEYLYRVDSRTGTLQKTLIAQGGHINVLKASADGSIWCYAREQGLFRVGNGIAEYTKALSLETTIVNELTEDSEGNLWIGTYSRGAYCVGSFTIRNYTVEHGLPGNYVSAVTEDTTGRIWIGSMGGITILEHNGLRALPNDILRHDEIPNAMLAVDDYCWIVTPLNLMIVSSTGNTKRRHTIGALSFCRTDGGLWMGQYSGIYALPDLRKLTEYDVLQSRRVHAMLPDRDGSIWIATDSGVFRYADARVQRYTSHTALDTSDVYSLCIDSSGGIWCATDNGLYRYSGDSSRVYTVEDGLSHNRCSSVLCDRSGSVWTGTLRGVNRWNGRTFEHYDSRRGLVADEINTLYLDSRDRLWIGTANGLTQLTLGRERLQNSGSVPVYMTAVTVNGSAVAVEPAQAHVFAFDRNTLHMYFHAVHFGNHRNVVYRYRLEGSGEGWQETSEHSVRYSSLPPGNYTFAVQASLAADDWTNARTARFAFTIEPPLWHRWWFLAGCGLVAVVLATAGIQVRERRFRRRQAEQLATYSRMLNLRQQALTALINPHFVFNSLNSIQFFISRANKELANEYLANFADLIRRTMDDSQCMVVPLRDELARLELYLELEALRFPGRFRYRISIDPELDLEEVLVPVMLIQPYVENAIWHGIMPKDGRGEVSVLLRTAPGSRLHIVVEDDGIGIEAAQRKRRSHRASRGMQLMKERLELIAKIVGKPLTVSVQERPAQSGGSGGTRVDLDIPLDLEQFAASSSLS